MELFVHPVFEPSTKFDGSFISCKNPPKYQDSSLIGSKLGQYQYRPEAIKRENIVELLHGLEPPVRGVGVGEVWEDCVSGPHLPNDRFFTVTRLHEYVLL